MYMFLNDLMKENNMTRSELSRVSGVPESTLRDILNGKAQLDHCEAGTLMAIADALDTTVEEIVVNHWEAELNPEQDTQSIVHDSDSLAYFYMSVADTLLKIERTSEMKFVCNLRKTDFIESFFFQKSFRTALFLVGLMDYIHRKFNLVPEPRFEELRKIRLDQPVYSLGTLAHYDAGDFIRAKEAAEKNAIPELARFNIFMTEEDIHPKMD